MAIDGVPMKEIEELRKIINNPYKVDSDTFGEMIRLLFGIENRIEHEYLKLPLDADGVPIHIGDMLLKSTGAPEASYGEVVGLSDDSVWFDAKNGFECNWANLTRHVKPDTIESLLDSFAKEIEDGLHKAGYDISLRKYAEKIRSVQ